MHSYTKKDNKFEKIIFTLAIISYMAAPFLSSLLEKNIKNEEITIVFSNLGFTISSATIFTILYFIFTKLLWKIPIFSSCLQVTNISGIWRCEGIGCKYDDKSIKNNWTGTIKIVQTLTKMKIVLTTDKSQSRSTSVISNLELHDTKECTLSYMYYNRPNDMAEGLNEHEGFCSLVFDLEKKQATGTYYTNPARKSYGTMKLEFVSR
ncbi:MAG: hypothetical protein IJW57_12050 [Spirochaetaceae bacterium]|nr:hypothetical protein [Spirochaetaceae bacterium]